MIIPFRSTKVAQVSIFPISGHLKFFSLSALELVVNFSKSQFMATAGLKRPLSNWKRAFMGLPAATGAGADAVNEDTGKTMGIANLRGCQGHAHSDPQKAREFHPRAIQIAFVLREFGSQGREEHLPWAGDRGGEGGGESCQQAANGTKSAARVRGTGLEHRHGQGKPPRDRMASRQRDIRRPNGVKLNEPTRETEALRTSLELCLPASNGLPFEVQLNKASVPTAELKKQENEKYLPSQQGLQARNPTHLIYMTDVMHTFEHACPKSSQVLVKKRKKDNNYIIQAPVEWGFE
ncbi:hypothetical protein B0H10DRAFT_1959603 [Mycena sp. CBHHK59/15]|nr:hypothetical protein B0H10DRAFT_1959603 [Mycena sp. CBHHK59/15]